MVSAGRVLLMPKGEYNAETTYSMLDIVSYNGSSYIAKQSTTGNLPTNTTYWQLSAYGGSASNLAGNFATLETTDYASKDYAIDDFLVNKNSQFCQVTSAITEGDELVVGDEGNLKTTDVGELIQAVIDYADSLDANNVQLKGMTAISAQTDLNDMTTIGNYYKSSTSFYVTNAPTGIASELTAVFRLTVENGSDTTNKYIQTLRTNDGKTYTRGYNGSAWGDWIEDASAASVALKQPKTLDTPITVGGTQETTVEGTLGALNSALSNEVVTRASLGAHQLFNIYDIAYQKTKNTAGSWAGNVYTHNGGTWTINSDMSITAGNTPTSNSYIELFGELPNKVVKIKNTLSSTNTVISNITLYDSSNTQVASISLENTPSGEDASIDLTSYTFAYVKIGFKRKNNNVSMSGTIEPLVRLASDPSTEFTPYAMTNRELTENVIKHTTYTGTTNSSGNLSIPSPYNKKKILAATVENASTYVSVGVNSSSEPLLCFRAVSNNASIGSGVSVSGIIFYIE